MKSRSSPQKLRAAKGGLFVSADERWVRSVRFQPRRCFGRRFDSVVLMTDEFRGLYRTVTGAYVTNGMMAFHVPEANYRVFGYEPDFSSLPWQDSYIAAAKNLSTGQR